LSIPVDLPIAVHELPIGCEIEMWTGSKVVVVESEDVVRGVVGGEIVRETGRKKTRRKAA
jgi:hypothetical protein